MLLRHRRSVALAAALLAVVALAGPVAADTVTATITVNITGLTGKFVPYGVVTDDHGNSCTGSCTFVYPIGSDVVFRPASNEVVGLVGLGACGTAAACTVRADGPRTFDVVYVPIPTQEVTVQISGFGLPMSYCCEFALLPHARVISSVMPPCEANGQQLLEYLECTATVPTFTTVSFAIQLDTPAEVFKSWGADGCVAHSLVCSLVADGTRRVGVEFGVNWFRAYPSCNGRLWTTNCEDSGATMTLQSPSIGTVVQPLQDCDAYNCRWGYLPLAPGETIHVHFELPAGLQLVTDAGCSTEVLDCDIAVDVPRYFRPALFTAEPGMPGNPRVVAGDGAVTATWAASVPPGLDGPTHYTVVAEPGHHSVTTTSTTVTIPGLDNGTEYWVVVTASNSHGASRPSQPGRATPIPAPTTYEVPWSSADLARIDAIAEYLGTTRAGVQETGVYLAAFLFGLDRTAPPEPTSLPAPVDDGTISTTWPDSALSVPRVVQDRLVLDGVDAHRFSVYLLSFLLSLTGH